MQVAESHRGRMRDHCVRLHRLLAENHRISLTRIGAELHMSESTTRRWVKAFAGCYDIRIESGVVIVGPDPAGDEPILQVK